MSQQKIIVDYLGLSIKRGVSRFDLAKMLNLPIDEFIQCPSKRNYEHCITYSYKVYIHWTDSLIVSPGVNPGVYIELTGQGCRKIEDWNTNFDWFKFLYQFHNDLTVKQDFIINGESKSLYNAKISRLDVACDLLDDDLITIDFLIQQIKERKLVTKAREISSPNELMKNGEFCDSHDTIYVGKKRQSDRFLRIYDKAVEQGLFDVKWLRFEFQMQNENATSFYLNLVECFGDWSSCYYGVLNDYLRFTADANDKSVNSTRLKTASWWQEFLDTMLKLKQLYLPGSAYTATRLIKYVERQVSSSLKTLLYYCRGDLTTLLNIINNADLNRQQKDFLRECGLKVEQDRFNSCVHIQ